MAPMSAKGNQHEVVKTALLHRWYRRTPEGFLLTPETTFRLSADTYLEPNVVVYSRTSGLEALSAPTVLLVLEIADSSLRYDSTRKAALYTSFGVRELWVIDAVTRATRVFRKPSAEGYGETLDFGESDLLTPEFAPPEFALRLDELESH
jgi:Uma2 family endonuclease